MSVAILPMKAEYGWDSATMGLVQSSFFWGYLLTQVCVHFSYFCLCVVVLLLTSGGRVLSV